MPPMATAKSDQDGMVTEELLQYYAEKSAGGYIGLIIVEHAFVRSDGRARAQQLSAADDAAVEGLEKLARIIKSNGSRTVQQINHAGCQTTAEITGLTPVAPSAILNPRNQSTPQELTTADIEDIITAFHNAALRVKQAGFDGVEIHSAHGYLLNQFFSPLTNKRNDRYGGELHNRIRIHLQIIEAIRSSVGKNFAILLRLGASDFTAGGTTIEDSQEAAREMEKAGIDILDVSGGFSGYTVSGLTGQGFFAPLTEALKAVLSIPVILTGGITEAQAAEKLLATGKTDLVGVGRAILEDSGWAKQTIESLR